MTGTHSIQTPEVTQQLPCQTTEGSRELLPEAEAVYQATPEALLLGYTDLSGNNGTVQVSHLVVPLM